jgi:hypothetical protein
LIFCSYGEALSLVSLLEVWNPSRRRRCKGISINGSEGPGTRCHHMSGKRLTEGESNGGGRGVPVVVVVVFLRGRPGQRVTVGVGCGDCGAPVEVVTAALAMAASTSGRHLMRFRVPG